MAFGAGRGAILRQILTEAFRLVLAGLVPALRLFNAFGAVLAFGIMTGALFFHLFTPLGIVIGDEVVAGVETSGSQTDGGLLFFMAVGVWIAAAILIGLHCERLLGLLRGLRGRA